MPNLRTKEMNMKTEACVDIPATVERSGPFPDVGGGVQGARTDGRTRSGAIEAGSKFSTMRGFGAATRGYPRGKGA